MADKSPSFPPQILESPKPTSTQLPDPAAEAENAVSDASGGRNLSVSVPSKERSGLLGSDGDGRSFSELLAGAMASPCYGSAPELVKSPKFKEHLGMTHQQVLASFTAQANMQLQSGRPSPSANTISQPTAVSPVTTQQRPPKLEIITSPHARELALAEHKSPSSHVIVKTASSDGYNWRKYGQKQVKSSNNARSYYRCTTAHCSSKKKVEHSQDGRVIDVVYQGEHNHEPPQKFRYPKEKGSQVSQRSVPLKDGPTLDPPGEGLSQSDNCSSKNSHNPENEKPPKKLHCSSDCEEDPGTNTEDLGEGPDPKRRLCEVPVSYSPSLFKTVREPKVVVQTAADGGPASDGYRWRKYGQKTVKGNPNPRSYYKCTHPGCLVRKHVERADGTKVFLTTYEGNHNHDLPPSRTSNDMLQSRSPNEAMKSPNSCGKSQARERKPDKGKIIGESKAEPGGEKIVDSAGTVVSSTCKPPKPEDDKSVTTDAGKVIQRPMFAETPTAVPVKNS